MTILRVNMVTLILGLLLVASNTFWLYATYSSFDNAVTLSYMTQQLHEYDASLEQAQSLLPVAFAATDKDSFVTAAQELSGAEGFEKGGCIWIDWLGFQFDSSSKLVHVSRTWNSGEPDPCFQDNAH